MPRHGTPSHRKDVSWVIATPVVEGSPPAIKGDMNHVSIHSTCMQQWRLKQIYKTMKEYLHLYKVILLHASHLHNSLSFNIVYRLTSTMTHQQLLHRWAEGSSCLQLLASCQPQSSSWRVWAALTGRCVVGTLQHCEESSRGTWARTRHSSWTLWWDSITKPCEEIVSILGDITPAEWCKACCKFLSKWIIKMFYSGF